MSTAPFLTLVSELLPVQRRDFYAANTALLNPNNANPLVDGEWLELDSSYKAARGTGEAAKPNFQLFAERGRYDTQAVGKVPLLFLGMYEARSKIVNTTGCAVGDALVVQDVTVSSLTKRGLAKLGAGAGQHMIFGYVTKVISASELQYITYMPHWKTVA